MVVCVVSIGQVNIPSVMIHVNVDETSGLITYLDESNSMNYS